MLPSWMRSRNCRPRLVYFLAIEITSRRFASVISRFARRALASPVDICLLISFRSLISYAVFCLKKKRRRVLLQRTTNVGLAVDDHPASLVLDPLQRRRQRLEVR